MIAADGGYASLIEAGVSPDVAIGDFDSLGYVPDAPLVQRHPVMKDASDLELSLEWAYREGFTMVVVYGALGGRLDQSMATFQTLVHYAQLGVRAIAVGEGSAVVALASDCSASASLRISSGPSGTVSVFPMGGDASGVFERGLLYELEDAVLSSGSTLGLSNELTGQATSIEVRDGRLLVFLPPVPLDVLS